MLVLALLFACAGGPDKVLSGDLVFTDANNYGYTGTLEVESTDVKVAHDVEIDWSGLTTDLRGRAVVPEEIDKLLLIAFGPEPDDVLAQISANDVKQSDVHDYRLFTNSEGVSSTSLSAFSVLGNDFQPEDDLVVREDVGTWAIALQDEVDDRDDILALAFMNLLEDTENSQVSFHDETTVLNFDATLGEALETGEDLTYTLDWSEVTLQAGGTPFDPLEADRLFLGHVSMESDADIEANFVQLLEVADQVYQLGVYGETSADLALATDDDGVAFPGFTTGGSWIVGIECTTCTSPAPVLLARVTVY